MQKSDWLAIALGVFLGVFLALSMRAVFLREKETPCIKASRIMYEQMKRAGRDPLYVIGHIAGSDVDHCVVGEYKQNRLYIYDGTKMLPSDILVPDNFEVYYAAKGKIKHHNGIIYVEHE